MHCGVFTKALDVDPDPAKGEACEMLFAKLSREPPLKFQQIVKGQRLQAAVDVGAPVSENENTFAVMFT